MDENQLMDEIMLCLLKGIFFIVMIPLIPFIIIGWLVDKIEIKYLRGK